MATCEDNQLTNNQIVRLARVISSQNMESIALGYLGIDDPVIKNFKYENRDNMEAFNREIIRHWMHRNPEPNQTQVLKSLLLKAAEECGYVDPREVEEILAACKTSPAEPRNNLSSNNTSITENVVETLTESIKLHTEESMKMERAPWLPEDFVDMDDLYTDLTLLQLCNKPKGPRALKISDYRDLFNNKVIISEPRVTFCTESKIEEGTSPAEKITKDPKKKKNKKLLFKGEPGMGKTSLGKKMTLDWARGAFKAFSLVLFVSLKLVRPGEAIENVIIQQNFWLEGLGVTRCKLEEILDVSGRKCLLILDGLDEHALGKNEDVLKIIRRQKLINCNIVITSRPHSITDIKKHFDVIAVVEGFSKRQARQFASKILSDKRQIDAVMRFDPYNDQITVQPSSVYKCPVLLSFLCILVQDNQIDLSSQTLSYGEIYSRMIRCLYMKYLRRQGREFCLNKFVEVMKALGKLAFESLLSGKFLFRKSQILNVIGPEAFDYRLLIGHEDAHRLIRDETADIFVTFAHRSIQEFLGAFFFVLSLEEGQNIEGLLGSNGEKTIFLVNPLFFHFCTWLAFYSAEIFQLEVLKRALDSMIHFVSRLINFNQLNTTQLCPTTLVNVFSRRNILQSQPNQLFTADRVCRVKTIREMDPLYPAINVSQAYRRGDTSNIKFFKELLTACDRVRHITLTTNQSENWMLDSVGFFPKSASTISFGNSKYCIPCHGLNGITLVINSLEFKAYTLFKFVRNIASKPEKIGAIRAFWFAAHDGMNCLQLLKNPLQELYILGHCEDTDFINFSEVDYCPSLTHLFLTKLKPVAQVCLSIALKEDRLSNLTNLGIIGTNLSDNLVTNVATKCKLTCLNLSYSSLSASGFQAIASLSNRLTSLMITAFWLPEEMASSFLQGPWVNLTNLSFHGTINFEIQNAPVVFQVINPENMPLIAKLFLTRCIKSDLDLNYLRENIALWKISKLDISHSRGIKGKLQILFYQTLAHLNSLILCDCGLNTQDLLSLTEASTTGILPKLQQLDISQNIGLDLKVLFERDCTWSQLESLSISLDKRDYEWLAGGVQLGCLSSVQQLRLWIWNDDIFTREATWCHVQKLEIFFSLKRDFQTDIEHIREAYENDYLPALRTECIMIGFPGDVLGHIDGEIDRLRKHNIELYTGITDECMFLSKIGILH